MTIIGSAQFNGFPSRFSKAQPLALVLFPENSLIADGKIFRIATQCFSRDFLELGVSIQACSQPCS